MSSWNPENTFILWNSNSVFPHGYEKPIPYDQKRLKRHSIFEGVKVSMSSQSNWEMCGNYFYAPWRKGEKCKNLVYSWDW